MLVKVLVVVGGLVLVLAWILSKSKVRWYSKRSDALLADTRQRVLEKKSTSRSHEVDGDSLGSVTRVGEVFRRGGNQGRAGGYSEQRKDDNVTRSLTRKNKTVSRAQRTHLRLGIETASRSESVSLVLINSEERNGRLRFVCARDPRRPGGETWTRRETRPSHAYPIVGLPNVTVEGDVMNGTSARRRTANRGFPACQLLEDVSALEEWCRPPHSLRGLSQQVPLPLGQRIIRLQVSPVPFHRGSRHQVFHAGYTSAKVQGGRPPPVVLKKCSLEMGFEKRLERMENNAIVFGLAGLFNQMLKSLPTKLPAGWKRLRFVKESFVHTLGDSKVRYFLEPFLGREFDKVGTSGMYSDKMPKQAADLLEAFSHWTYTKSEGAVMVTQCEVVKAGDVFWLRKPVLRCSFSQGCGKSSEGCAAMEQFLNKHKCNKYCHAVGATRDPVPKPLKERVKKILASIEKRAKFLRPKNKTKT